MKRLLTLLCSLILLAATAEISAKSPKDLSGIEQYATTYFEGKAPMLNGLSLYSYGIYPELSKNLTALQLAVIESDNYNEARTLVHKLTDGWEKGLSMKTDRANIVVFGTPDKDGVYDEVVIGIGLPGRLIYMYLQGRITGNNLGMLLMPYQPGG